MIDKSIIGLELPPFAHTPDANQLRFFAKSIGETDPIYSEESAAKEAGHPGLPLPPTYFFSAEMYRPASHGEWREKAGITLQRLLHGEQSFTFHRMAYAGDTLHYVTKVVDAYDKKDGALTFVVLASKVTNQHGEHIADVRKSMVHRNR